MTYFGFLAIFLIIPIGLFAWLNVLSTRRDKPMPSALQNLSIPAVLSIHVVIALLYTTPWDNYLVATRVWWYDPDLVTGIVIGWVPIEEYTFFVLQPILSGLWLTLLARHLSTPSVANPDAANSGLRRGSTLLAGLLWLASTAMLLTGWGPGTYLGLELFWALPPIMLQLIFGADILWQHRKLIAWSLIPATLYLSFADALAIGSGTWTINPALSLQIYLGGVLPIEEFIFFLLTNILLVFGVTLMIASRSRQRVDIIVQKYSGQRTLSKRSRTQSTLG